MTMTISERLDRLNTMVAEDRIIRNNWDDINNKGQELACLLTALAPEAGAAQSSRACPIQIMPQWMANLSIWMNDNGSKKAWHVMIRRYAAVARRWNVLTTEDWNRLNYTTRRIAIEVILSHIPNNTRSEERATYMNVIALCHSAEAGNFPTPIDWSNAVVVPGIKTPWPGWPGGIWAMIRMNTWTAWVVTEREEPQADLITALIFDAIEAACDRRTALVN